MMMKTLLNYFLLFFTISKIVHSQPPIPGHIYPECLRTYQCTHPNGQFHPPDPLAVSVACQECAINPGWGTFCCVHFDSCKQTGFHKPNKCPDKTFEVGGCTNDNGAPCGTGPCCIKPLPPKRV